MVLQLGVQLRTRGLQRLVLFGGFGEVGFQLLVALLQGLKFVL